MTDTMEPAGLAEPPFATGVQLAAARLERYGIFADVNEVRPSIELALGLVQEVLQHDQLSQRGGDYFFESVTVAAVMRRKFQEPELTDADLRYFLEASRSFLNSFWHVDW